MSGCRMCERNGVGLGGGGVVEVRLLWEEDALALGVQEGDIFERNP